MNDTASTTTAWPSHDATAMLFAANIITATPEEYQSFFARHAVIAIILLAGIGAVAIVRWRKQPQQFKQQSGD